MIPISSVGGGGGAGGGGDSKVETISRLAQWRVENFGPCSVRRSDPFKLGIWNWVLSVEKNRYMHVRLFPENSRISKEQPPLAKFVLRVSSSAPGRRTYISPVFSNTRIKEAKLVPSGLGLSEPPLTPKTESRSSEEYKRASRESHTSNQPSFWLFIDGETDELVRELLRWTYGIIQRKISIGVLI